MADPPTTVAKHQGRMDPTPDEIYALQCIDRQGFMAVVYEVSCSVSSLHAKGWLRPHSYKPGLLALTSEGRAIAGVETEEAAIEHLHSLEAADTWSAESHG